MKWSLVKIFINNLKFVIFVCLFILMVTLIQTTKAVTCKSVCFVDMDVALITTLSIIIVILIVVIVVLLIRNRRKK